MEAPGAGSTPWPLQAWELYAVPQHAGYSTPLSGLMVGVLPAEPGGTA